MLSSVECADINSYYKKHGCFDEKNRKALMRIMCNELLKGQRVSNETLSQISSNVCLVFLTESKVYNASIPI